ncbi:MAG: DUF3467 domain-containing protein [Candidatus Methanospirareceae archaeon]
MSNKKSKTMEKEHDEVKSKKVEVDLEELYRFESKDVFLDLASTHYSNLANIQVSSRDVYIDFLEMPSIKKEGKSFVTGTRIYMSHVAAQRLAEALSDVLEHVHKAGEMEKFLSQKERKKE